jgi:membrane protease YdiL (CAAX protease family)
VRLDAPPSFGLSIVIQATLGFLLCVLPAIGEEIGWRGFLAPELAKRIGFTKTSLLIGIIWAVWHYPLFLVDFTDGKPTLLAFVCFTLNTVGMTFVMTWIRLKSGSLWTGVILHASHNLFLEGFFNVLTVNKETTEIVTTDFGIGAAVVYLALAFVFWKKRSELP